MTRHQAESRGRAATGGSARYRLGRRYRRLVARGKMPQVAVCAVARESVGFIWAIAHAAGPKQR